MKRFVYTSSSFAVTLPKPGKKFTVTADTFNDEAVERAWKPNPDGATVYSASKVEAERAISKWTKEHKPSLIVNTSMKNFLRRKCNPLFFANWRNLCSPTECQYRPVN